VVPAFNEANVRHLLRRTEFGERDRRITELLATGSMAAAVDDVLAVAPPAPPRAFASNLDYQQDAELNHDWFNRMAYDSPRPMQERMAFFWHGHFCSEFYKAGGGAPMRDQLQIFRVNALGNFRLLARAVSSQVAMLRYLDNNLNRSSSPNQNFARELMELFVVGVGTYNERDVEAATAAWTGYADDAAHNVVWHPEWHDGSTVKSFLGRAINAGGDARTHGIETIDVMLTSGIVPNDAPSVVHRGRFTRDVAAEFLSRKLWRNFAGGTDSTAAIAAMSAALKTSDFAITPWVRAMLLHDDFYSADSLDGLVRSPVDFLVAMLRTTGQRSENITPLWLAEAMGQRLLSPPDVSGWHGNESWVNASAMDARARAADEILSGCSRGYWGATGLLEFAGGSISLAEISARDSSGTPIMSNEEFLNRVLSLMGVRLSAETRDAILSGFLRLASVWERNLVVQLILASPEFQMA
jgi:uncharacterized protein (DUF1800 family)